jgi:hypothetical protein
LQRLLFNFICLGQGRDDGGIRHKTTDDVDSWDDYIPRRIRMRADASSATIGVIWTENRLPGLAVCIFPLCDTGMRGHKFYHHPRG